MPFAAVRSPGDALAGKGVDSLKAQSHETVLTGANATPCVLALAAGECQHITAGTCPAYSRRGRELMGFRPLHDRVLVRRTDSDEVSAGGIIIPDTAREKPMEGEVIAVGPGARDDRGAVQPLDVAKGDRVLFGKWSGTDIRIDGEELLVMKESDIMGVL